MSGVDTGRTTAPSTVSVPTPSFQIGSTTIPGGTQAVQVPGTPIMRPSFLQAFLANLGPALAGGLQAQPGMPFGTGLGGALQGIEQFKQRVFQNSMEYQNLQREQAQTQSAIAAQQSQMEIAKQQAGRAAQLFPYQLQEAKLNSDLLQAQVNFFGNPANITGAIQDATKSLGKLSPDEQAQIDTAAQEAKVTRKFDAVNAAVKSIAQDRAKANLPDVQQYINNYLKSNDLPDTPANRLKAHADFISKTKVIPQIQILNATNPMAGAPTATTPSPNAAPGAVPTGEDTLRGMNPTQQTLVRGVADYTINPNTVRSNRNPAAQAQLIAAAKSYNPAYDETAFPEKQKLRNQIAVQSQALNTATHHLDNLSQAIDNLGNSSAPIWNRIANEYGVQTGAAGVPEFNAVKDAVAGELGKIFKGGGMASDAEIKAMNATLSSASSPAQLKGVVKQDLNLMQGRLSGLQETYEGQIGIKPNFQIVSPRAQAIFDRNSSGQPNQGLQFIRDANGRITGIK